MEKLTVYCYQYSGRKRPFVSSMENTTQDRGSPAGPGWEDHQANMGNNKIPELVVLYRGKIPLLR